MARETAPQNDLLIELQEEDRAMALNNAWARWGNTIIVACILVVLGTAAGVYWQHRKAELSSEQTALFMAAAHQMEQGEYKESAAAFGRVARLGGPIYPLAILRQAQALQEQGDDQAAINALQTLAEDESADELMRSVAALWIVRLADADKQPQVIERLTNRVADPKNPLWALGVESKALWLLKQGKVKEAQTELKALTNSVEVPTAVAQRARMISQAEIPAETSVPAPEAK